MVTQIVIDPNPILRKIAPLAKPEFLASPEFKKLTKNLIDTLYASDGVGIAAPQIGESIAVCVINKRFSENKKIDLVLVNPVWTKATLATAWGEEGCLSVPNLWGKVKRYKKIKVKAWNENGQPLNFVAEDFFARAIQHEADHLRGVLFIDKAKDLYTFEKK
ncbi:MAG: peptide deformylase [Patescibacteria group bacterium]